MGGGKEETCSGHAEAHMCVTGEVSVVVQLLLEPRLELVEWCFSGHIKSFLGS